MAEPRRRHGLSLGLRLVLAGILLALMVALPVFFHPRHQSTEVAVPTELTPSPIKPVAAKPEPSKSVPVEAATVTKGPLTEQVTAVGSLRSDESVVITSEIAGRIDAIHFKEGTSVPEGAPLISLDDSVYQAELHQAEAKQRSRRAEKSAGDGAVLAQDRERELQGRGGERSRRRQCRHRARQGPARQDEDRRPVRRHRRSAGK